MTFSTLPSGLVEAIGAAGAALTTLCWLPQATKIIRDRDTRAISLPGTTLCVIGVLLWLIYGLAIVDAPLIGSSVVTFAMTLVILVLKIRTADGRWRRHAAAPPSSRLSSPCSNWVGVGGQPAMCRSTGTTALTPPVTA